MTILSRWSKGPREPPERLSQAKTDRKSRAQDVSQGRRLLVSRGVHCYPLGILARASLEIPVGTQLSTCVSTRGLCAGRLGGYILRSSCTAGVYLEEVALVSLETACCRNKAYCLASLAATLCPHHRPISSVWLPFHAHRVLVTVRGTGQVMVSEKDEEKQRKRPSKQ